MAYEMIKKVSPAPACEMLERASSEDSEAPAFDGFVRSLLEKNNSKTDVQTGGHEKDKSTDKTAIGEVLIDERPVLTRTDEPQETSLSIIAEQMAAIENIVKQNDTPVVEESDVVALSQAVINFVFQSENVALNVSSAADEQSSAVSSDSENNSKEQVGSIPVSKTGQIPVAIPQVKISGKSPKAVSAEQIAGKIEKGVEIVMPEEKQTNASAQVTVNTDNVVIKGSDVPVVSYAGKAQVDASVQEVFAVSDPALESGVPENAFLTSGENGDQDLSEDTDTPMSKGNTEEKVMQAQTRIPRAQIHKVQVPKLETDTPEGEPDAGVFKTEVSGDLLLQQQISLSGSGLSEKERMVLGSKRSFLQENGRDDGMPSMMNAESRVAVAGKEGVLPGMVEQMMKRVATLQEVVDRFDKTLLAMVSGNDTSMTIHLVPPNLGKLTISCRESAGDLALNIVAENGYARSFLMNNEQTIRDVVTQNGYKLSQFDVSSGNDDGSRRWFTGDREVEKRGQARKTGWKGIPASIAAVTPEKAQEINENGGLWFVA